jgi:hypothetical protein
MMMAHHLQQRKLSRISHTSGTVILMRYVAAAWTRLTKAFRLDDTHCMIPELFAGLCRM